MSFIDKQYLLKRLESEKLQLEKSLIGGNYNLSDLSDVTLSTGTFQRENCFVISDFTFFIFHTKKGAKIFKNGFSFFNNKFHFTNFILEGKKKLLEKIVNDPLAIMKIDLKTKEKKIGKFNLIQKNINFQ